MYVYVKMMSALNYLSNMILNNLITVLNHPKYIKVYYYFGGWTTLNYTF